VAEEPRVESTNELAALIQEGTGDCDDLETPVSIAFPGLERAMCTVAGHQITLTVRTGGLEGRNLSWRRGFTTDETGSDPSRLTDTNWVLVGQPGALASAQEAIGGELTSD
jgi:hypothetical protein